MTLQPSRRNPHDWLFNSQFAPHVDAFTHYLAERGYAAKAVNIYLGCLAHFAHWMSQIGADIHRINEVVVSSFLNHHLPVCDCAYPVVRTRANVQPALGHLIAMLRVNAIIPERALGSAPVNEELRNFDDHMNHVRGLGLKVPRSLLLRAEHVITGTDWGSIPH